MKITRTAFKLKRVKSRIHRYGVIAMESIPARKRVIEYTGKLYSRRDWHKADKSVYVWNINTYWCMDGGIGGSGAEFINHSCDPNLRVAINEKTKKIFYWSRRAIKKGEELTVDYRFDPDPKPTPCDCGAKKCRGTINVVD